MLVALATACGGSSGWRDGPRYQYQDREWRALVAVPAQTLARPEAAGLAAGSIWVSVDGTAYPGAPAGDGASIASPIERAPLRAEQLGVVARDMWFRSTSEDGNFHGISVPLHLALGDLRESRTVLIQVDADQPCRLGTQTDRIRVQQCSGADCSTIDAPRIAPDGDGLYRVGDLRVAVTVVCELKQRD